MARKLAPLPYVLFGLIVSVLVGSRSLVQQGERTGIVGRLESTSAEVAHRLEVLLEEHLALVSSFAEEFSADSTLEEGVFRTRSARYQAQTKGVQALNLVALDGTIRWVEPEIGNRGALGFDLSKHPIAGPAFRAARDGSKVELTPPLPLLQRGWGIAAYRRIQSSGQTVGLANCVFRLDDLLARCVDEFAEPGLGYRLRFGEETLAALGDPTLGTHGSFAHEVPVRMQEYELTLRMTASPVGSAQNSWVDEAMLALGILLAGFLVWMVQVARYRHQDSEIAGERYRVLLENAPDAVLTIDGDSGRLLDANRRAFELFDYSRVDFLALDPALISPERQPDGQDSIEAFREHLAATLEGETPVFEWTILTSQGHQRLTEVHLVAMPSDGRRIVRTSIMDISQRRELEDKLRRTHVHEAVGQLAGGVAHDFNNMLTAILGACELLSDRCREDAESVELASSAIEACQRASELTRRLLTFNHTVTQENRALDVNAVISGLLPMLSRVLSEQIELKTQLDASLPILGSASQIELVLLNLVVNARDAMPLGGTILISSKDVGSDTVSFSVKDEGEGIPRGILDKVFEPFFTTKQADAGSGIGLATVRQIVDQVSGTIQVESRVSVGTEFIVSIPAIVDEPARALTPVKHTSVS